MEIKDLFITAINGTDLVKLTFTANNGETLTRTCAPMDYGPWRRCNSSNDIRYHLMDLDSSAGTHNLSIKPSQIIKLELLDEKFKPEYFVHWVPNWHIARDWGIYS